MKKLITLTLLFALLKPVFSQNSERFSEIITHLKKKEYYEGIKKIDSYLRDYPTNAPMYFNRGVAELYLSDYYSARKDLLMAKKLGITDRDKIINQVTSKKYMVDILSKAYITDCKLDSANGFKPIFSYKDTLRGMLRPERTCFDVYFYSLTVKVLPKTKSIKGVNQIYFKTTQPTKKIQIDLASNLQVNSILWKGKELKYSRIYDAIFIEFNEEIPANESHMIAVSYSGVPRVAPTPPWNGGFVWKKKKRKYWIGVACEHLGSSVWWPSKDHLSDKPDSMTINVQAPTGYQGIANGDLRSQRDMGDKYTNFEWHVSYPINCYNVTLYVGNFINFNETFTNQNGSYKIDYYVLPHHLEKAQKYYSKTKDIVAAYEKLFGEYPYKKDGMAMVEAPYTGMEHQSAIAIGDEYGEKKRRTYEDTDYDYLVVHETAHEWWGNTIAVSDMADAWLSEGFATYAEHLFIENKLGYNEYISAVAKTMQRIQNIWPVVGIKNVNDNTFIGGDIYHKGAAMLNNLRCIINNDSLFFSIIKGFYNKYKYKTIGTKEFTTYVNESTGNDYTDFFTKFLNEIDPPILQYRFKLLNRKLTFTYEWKNVGKNFSMPFCMTINNEKNIRLTGSTQSQTIEFNDVDSFYLPNEGRLDKNKITPNSFTYYWASWIH